MKYVVEVCCSNHNEWSEETEDYREAIVYAMKVSKLADVCEARVYEDDELVSIYVDGLYHAPQEEEYEEEEWNEWDDDWDDDWSTHIDPYDEVGYDPYTGGYDMDL